MKMENYFLPHMGYAAAFLRRRPFLATIVANFVFPISLHVGASSIHRSLFEDCVCFASVLPWPLLWHATNAAIAPFPLSLSVEFHT